MAKILGVGGVFFKANDPAGLMQWYCDTFGLTGQNYEQMGAFYLGREYDLGRKELQDGLVLYDSKDLVTHGVVLGMTGSGKTGLCFALRGKKIPNHERS